MSKPTATKKIRNSLITILTALASPFTFSGTVTGTIDDVWVYQNEYTLPVQLAGGVTFVSTETQFITDCANYWTPIPWIRIPETTDPDRFSPVVNTLLSIRGTGETVKITYSMVPMMYVGFVCYIDAVEML